MLKYSVFPRITQTIMHTCVHFGINVKSLISGEDATVSVETLTQ